MNQDAAQSSNPIRRAARSPFKLKPMVAGLLATVAATPAMAIDFSMGPVDGQFQSTISLGALWRMEDQSDALIGIANGGTARSVNIDDGNLNYDKGDIVSTVLKGTHELTLSYDRYSLFVRGYEFYDFTAADDEDNFGDRGEDRLVADAKFLDAFVNASWGRTTARLGWQVLNWGESTFIQNGISVINPVDVSKIRSPGAELREAYIPSSMLWVSQGLTDNLSAEAYIQFSFDEIELDPRGSYFSTTDVASDDGYRTYLTFGRRKDQHYPLTNPVDPTSPLYPLTQAAGLGEYDPAASVWFERDPNETPDGFGQYGVALRYFSPTLNYTEFALYHLEYHSRLPYYNTRKSDIPGATGACSVLTYTDVEGVGNLGDIAGQNCSASYFIEYPEDIRLYGLSFNTSAPWGVALQGEYSFRDNMPLALPGSESVMTAVGVPSLIAPDPSTVAPGADVQGYRRVKMHQVQMTATKAFPQLLGADQLVTLVEAGYTNLDLPDDLVFDAAGVQLPFLELSGDLAANGSTQGEGYATESSWGYRAVLALSYPSVIRAININPRIAWSHDVNGASPTFVEDTKALTFGVGFSYQQNWTADLAYTAYFGGREYCGTDPVPYGDQPQEYCTSSNLLEDRDFLAATVSYSF